MVTLAWEISLCQHHTTVHSIYTIDTHVQHQYTHTHIQYSTHYSSIKLTSMESIYKIVSCTRPHPTGKGSGKTLLISLCPRNVKHVRSPWKHELSLQLPISVALLDWSATKETSGETTTAMEEEVSPWKTVHCQWQQGVAERFFTAGWKQHQYMYVIAAQERDDGFSLVVSQAIKSQADHASLCRCYNVSSLISHCSVIRSRDVILQSDWFATIPGKGHNAINSVLPDPFPVGWGLARETIYGIHH